MIFNMTTSYFCKFSIHYFEDYLMMKLSVRHLSMKEVCLFVVLECPQIMASLVMLFFYLKALNE
jgi:hypothetical protein